MPERAIRLNKSQASDLAVVCSLGAQKLEHLMQMIESAPVTIHIETIQNAIATEVGKEKAEAVNRALFGLATASRRGFDAAAELMDRISSSPPSQWDDATNQQWRDCRPALERLLTTKSVVLATKAADLSFDVERFCLGVRIITDIRPVFDEPRNMIVGSTIRQTLRMEYMSVDGTSSGISVGLDADDIARLKKACEEATRKTDVVRKTLEKAGLPEMLIPGEDV